MEKILNTLSKCLPEKWKVLLLEAIVISHLHYSALILIGLQKSLLTNLEKQLNWGIKTILIGENAIGLPISNFAAIYYQFCFS